MELTNEEIRLIRVALRCAWNTSFLSPDVPAWKELYERFGELTDDNG